MKRDVCVVAPDYVVPAERFRAVFWCMSGFRPGKYGAESYKFK
jgi:hypothetical protein